ncbi:MAG TPA: DMT family transporter [Thermoanaerobaculia bacterium]|nr:DMT family transporter [Thermoanaerobaculia bacterium]
MSQRSSPGAGAYLAILFAALFFSTGGAAIKATALGSWQVASLRSGVGAMTLLLLLPGARRRVNPRIVVTAIALASTLLLFVHANKLTTAANTIFLQSTAPLWILVLAPRLLGERPRRADVIYTALLALGAVAFFVGIQEPFSTAPDPRTGNLLALVAGFTWALALMGLRWVQWGERDPAGAAGATVVWGNVLACLAALPAALPIESFRPVDLGVVAYLGVFQIGAAYALMTRAVRRLRALEVALFMLLEPVASAVWAWWLHGERPGPWALAGGALILGSTAWRAAWGSRLTAAAAR